MTLSAPWNTTLLAVVAAVVLGACSSGAAGGKDGGMAGEGGGGGEAAFDGGDATAGRSPDAPVTDAPGADAPPADATVADGAADASDAGIGKTVRIPATANIWGAGHAIPPAPSGSGAGLLPTLVQLPPGTGRTMTVTNVSGAVDFDGMDTALPENGADGFVILDAPPLPDGSDPFTPPTVGGIAGLTCAPGACPVPRIAFLGAVFLDDAEPVEPAPAPYAADPRSQLIEHLVVRQTFFVGDGFNGDHAGIGLVQVFRIPDGATRLFFGFFDQAGPEGLPGSYDDNTGELRATVTVSR
jgi:hypothetical protein